MSEPPRISVILLAHSRRRYVLGGVESALRQTLPRERYEVLVFKNFEDPEIDPYLDAHGVRSLTSPADSRPRTLRTVLGEARGEVLAFLDDDDLFTPEKLAVVDRRFRDDPTLGYFHNGFVVMTEDGRPFAYAPFPQVDRPVRIPAGDGRTRWYPPDALRLGYNTSSVSVRRNWLEPFLDAFDHPEAELSDAMMIACALVSGCGILAEPTRLTRYRYHDSWSNILHYTPESVGQIIDFDQTNIAALNLIGRLAEGTTLAPLVANDLAYVRFHRSVFAGGADWHPTAGDFVRLIVGGAQQKNLAPFYLIPLHVMARISPTGARDAYFHLAERFRRHSFGPRSAG